MIKIMDAITFFGKNRPRGIPSDSETPDMKQLIDRTKTLDSSPYPYTKLKAILKRENRRLGAGKAAIKSITSIDSRTVFVVGGQQAGLFGGPLYTLYKAMHTVRLSSRLSELTGRNVIPLFWVASDDHDFEEVKRIGVKTHDGKQLAIEYSPRRHIEGEPVGEIILDEGIFRAIESLAKLLPTGNTYEKYLEVIRRAWQPERSWSDAFAVQMLRLFSPYGLVIFDPRWKGVKDLNFKNIFVTELSEPLTSSALVNEEADKFENPGMRKQALRKPEGSTNLFLSVKGIRYPLITDKQGLKAGKYSFSKRELLDMVDSTPDRFSPAAALRPVCQDALLPVAALISGPGERIYLQQIKPLYSHFGVNGSIPWPRASFTIIDSRIQRNAQKEQIPLHRMFDDIDRIRTDLANSTFPGEVKRELDSLNRTVETGFSRLASRIGSIDPTLENSVIKDMGKVLHTIKGIRERSQRAHKASLAISEVRLLSASYFLLPNGGPQERWFGADSIIPFLDEEGFGEFLTMTSPNEERHRIIIPQ